MKKAALLYEAHWFDFKDARLKIRPVPIDLSDGKAFNGGFLYEGYNAREVFILCLTEWEGVVDAGGKNIPCTDEIKAKIFDLDMAGYHIEGLVAFVLETAINLKILADTPLNVKH